MSTTLALRRSAELEEMIDADAGRFRILTGDRPTGPLHLGHYFGTLRNRVRLADLGAEVFVLIADYQVLTDRDTAEHLDSCVTGMLLDYLAIGLDRATIFAHSAVPALNQLLLPFLSLVSVPELSRNPTIKDEIAHSRQSAVSGAGGSAALKDTVTAAVNETLAPVRARRAEYARDPGYVRQVLRDGNERANDIAATTLAGVRTAMGMRY
ncbi:MAG: hypothetical protein ACRDPY_23205 [Streptosporangiaceae bacterium]